MRISVLAAAAGLPVATVKYYLRERLLPAGVATSTTQATYDDGHVQRLRLIRALIGTVGLSVEQTKRILQLVDQPGDDLYRTLGRALDTLPPGGAAPRDDADPYPRARAALSKLGRAVDPAFGATAQLEAALVAAEAGGVPVDDDRLRLYGETTARLAAFDLDRLPADDAAAIEYAVLGTALHEPVLLALRRLAHQQVALERLPARTSDPT
ncbi:MerR family transcriptional regulator [Agromyces aerolatus]|uniref:MerR family transcriptional regulator n=1 Tax=Agromyces sp. LY-1074 TaxID=3074080 RepID=UPI002860D008|nr:MULTISPECIES: MerR family transcriptional regulator [unclassified Agromyces]MDR5700942.1 MerR family transcriptional regulator [Agromyces sp. LY-1074]MDR5707397.1 MerR family transcriptional regulator [Agromyces sp. LY-1358]